MRGYTRDDAAADVSAEILNNQYSTTRMVARARLAALAGLDEATEPPTVDQLGAGSECDGGDWCTQSHCQWSSQDGEFYVSFSRGGMDYDDQPCPCEHHDEWRRAVAR